MSPIHSLMNPFFKWWNELDFVGRISFVLIALFLGVVFSLAQSKPSAKEGDSFISEGNAVYKEQQNSMHLMKKGGFPSLVVYEEADAKGFSDYEAWKKFKASGFSSKDEYTENVSRGIGTSKKLVAMEAKAGKLGMNIGQYLMHLDIKSRCKTPLNYRGYMRHPEKFEDVGFKIKGSISQVTENGFLMQTEYNSFVNMYSGGTVYVQIPFSINVFNPVEDDVITLYGFGLGVQEYETVLGAMNRVPMFQAGTVDLHN